MLLVGASSKRQHLETAGIILRTLWALYIVNVVVLIGDGRQQQADGDDDDDDVRLYTYFPYGEDYCERALPVVWNVYERGVGFVHREHSPFPPKLDNFYHCPLAVATFPVYPFIIPSAMMADLWPGHPERTEQEEEEEDLKGIEAMVLRTLRQRLNFRLQLMNVDPPDWGTAGPRDQATGASAYVSSTEEPEKPCPSASQRTAVQTPNLTKQIRHLRANLTIGYWATTLHRNRYMASSFAYYTSQLVLAVPPGAPYTSLELLRCPLAKPIWTFLLCSLAAGLAVIGLLVQPIVDRV